MGLGANKNELKALTKYKQTYAESIKDPPKFWAKLAEEEIEWLQKWDKAYQAEGNNYQWFAGGKLNVTVSCLDRHIAAGNGGRTAYIHLGEDGQRTDISYKQLLSKVNQLANGLKTLGIKKGDRVVIYMPLIIEEMVAMLACARIGAVHSVVFGGFYAPAVRQRIDDLEAKAVITADWTMRHGAEKELLPTVLEAVDGAVSVKDIITLYRGSAPKKLPSKVVDYDELTKGMPEKCDPEVMDSEDILFVLYTSGSTGAPKGIVHTCGGYILYSHYTTKKVFDVKPGDVYWCTADPGWITGHSYVLYGPLSNGLTVVIAEGGLDYPSPDRWYKIIEDNKVKVFYTSPTAIRMLRLYGEDFATQHNLSSLKIIGTVGEPINPDVWDWYQKYVGAGKCPVEDTWWQTETGGHVLVTMPGLPQKPGKAGLPFFGVEVGVVDQKGRPVKPGEKGYLVIKHPWPGAMRTCLNNPKRFEQYWNEIPGMYLAGDFAIKDEDGYIQILGRSDDVIEVSGMRVGSAEIENALVSHPQVAEAAVIGKPDNLKGERIKAFIILRGKPEENDDLVRSIKSRVKDQIASLAIPDEVEFVAKLPKTRSGKIMRRVLKAREFGYDEGDLSALED